MENNTGDDYEVTDDPEANALTPEKRLANLFFDLYKGLDRAYGKYVVSNKITEAGEKVDGRATTETGDYSVRLWNLHLNGNQGLGVVPITDDGTCWWGAIDIDVYPLDLAELERKIHELGLPLIVVRTKSGGAHLTLFLSEPVSCKIVRNRLHEFAMALGYGNVEIFPKQVQLASNKDMGNWLNMPYFEHRATRRYAIHEGRELTAEQFLTLAYELRVDEDQLKAIEIQLAGEFDDGPPCLQMMAKQGVPKGSRNNTMFAIAVYSKLKFEDDWEAKLEEMNRTVLDEPLPSKEIQSLLKSNAKKEYHYPCNKAPLNQFCNRDLCRKREFGIGQLEEDFTLTLGSLTKMESDPPLWIIDVDGVRIQMDTEDLMNQERFRRLCVMKVNKLPGRIKQQAWEKIVREKLANVESVEAPMEAKPEMRVTQFAQLYLMRTPPARSKDEVLIGRPWLEKDTDKIWFQGNDLIRYLENNGIKQEVRKVWASLREAGYEQIRTTVKGRETQIWKVPKTAVPDISLDVPDDPTGAF